MSRYPLNPENRDTSICLFSCIFIFIIVPVFLVFLIRVILVLVHGEDVFVVVLKFQRAYIYILMDNSLCLMEILLIQLFP